MCVMYWCDCRVCSKTKGQIILVVPVAHHTPNITSCNGILWHNMGFSADLYLLFCEFTCSLRWYKALSLNRTIVGVTLLGHRFTDSTPASQLYHRVCKS